MNNDNLEIDGIIYSPVLYINYRMRYDGDIIPNLIINSKIGDLYVFGRYDNIYYYTIKSFTNSSVVLTNNTFIYPYSYDDIKHAVLVHKTLSIYRSISEIRISKLMTIYG